MERKKFEEYFKVNEQLMEAVKNRLGITDEQLVQLSIDVLMTAMYNSNSEDNFSGALGGTVKVKNQYIDYNFSMGEIAAEKNEKMKSMADEFVDLNKNFKKKLN